MAFSAHAFQVGKLWHAQCDQLPFVECLVQDVFSAQAALAEALSIELGRVVTTTEVPLVVRGRPGQTPADMIRAVRPPGVLRSTGHRIEMDRRRILAAWMRADGAAVVAGVTQSAGYPSDSVI